MSFDANERPKVLLFWKTSIYVSISGKTSQMRRLEVDQQKKEPSTVECCRRDEEDNFMKLQIQRTGFLAALITMIVIACLCIWGIYYGLVTDPEMQWLAGIGGLFLIALVFMPVGTAYDLSDEIPEIKELKKDKRYKNVKIRHSSFWWVVIWSTAALFSGGLTWFLALFLVSGTINVDIPDDVAIAAGLKEGMTSTPSFLAPSSSEELLRWKKLFDDGVITEEEFQEKKAQLI